ncbi:MAG: ribosome maturation factor RimP [Gammaproteobacteria bacterium]
MRPAADHLTNLIEPIVSGMGYECVAVEFVPHGKQSVLRVFIDSERGIGVDDCAKVSHQLSGLLDVEDPIQGNYQLEVSSPGLDRPLCKLVDFDRFKGHRVRMELLEALEGRRRIQGVLSGVREEIVLLQVDGVTLDIPFERVGKAFLAPDVTGLKHGKRNGK